MAQIWKDISGSMNNAVNANSQDILRFKWFFITFSGETQEQAEVKWRKLGAANAIASGGMLGFIKPEAMDSLFSPVVSVGRFEDTNTWTLSGGQYVPPAEGSRRYSNITHVDLPLSYFSEGVWTFWVRMKPTGQDWQGWTSHKVEINSFDDRSYYVSSGSAQVKGPAHVNEGRYGVRVEVISAAGISGMSNEQQFDVLETNRYLKDSGGVVEPVSESRFGEAGIIGRVRRT